MFVGPTILHADLDAFYASVEQLLDPALRGRPIAVGGSAHGGVVLAASYEAKAFGVQGGMPGWRAARLCPELVFVRGNFSRYQPLADQVMDILGDLTPAVQRISIDEAFLDVSGSVHLFGPPGVIGARLRARVRAEVGLAISVGAARTKHLAKVASQVAKPDGLVVVEPERERGFLDPLPVALMWGVGPVTQQHLADRGIHTIGELGQATPAMLRSLLGPAAGERLHALAHNTDPRRVSAGQRARSVGAQSALGRREPTAELVRSVLGHLAERVGGRMRAKDRAGRTITVRVRFAGMRTVTRSSTLGAPVSSTLTITEVAERLVWQALGDQGEPVPEVSLLAISVSNLGPQHGVQLELPLGTEDPWRPGSAIGSARWALDASMDAARARFGRNAVGYLPATLGRGAGVPDDFRELAEKDLG
ncbi:DNA polymerase IV [Occultella aeris]|uniref:DNA polymerase IV n=1 Tax=Occultella aeris TaxID=2761496 RepID=A0A7M4DS06_9MICO|nr:DNA polymerase IV [Occultella aeris]VZO40250.1 DNA polymerase IV [Occultella aeris]